MFVAALVVAAVCSAAPAPVVRLAPADSLAELYATGKTWAEFFEAARSRKEMWRDNYENGLPDSAAVARGRAVGGSWKILVVAEDWCGDSANTVPYLVRWVDSVPGIELRIVNSRAGGWVMDRHQTPDGRSATPTILLLGPDGNERGCFVERPAQLRAWVGENKSKLSDDEFQSAKMKWYRTDRGRSTVAEFVELLELAAAGTPRCGSN